MKVDRKILIRSSLFVWGIAFALLAGCRQEQALEKGSSSRLSALQIPVIKGRFKHILDAPGQTLTNAPRGSWYINDHCFFVEKNGTIHWFGINNPYPEDEKKYYVPGSHRHIGHAVADKPFGPWTACEHALQLAPDDTRGNRGACWVIEKAGRYLMYFSYDRIGLGIAESSDLYEWKILDQTITLGGFNTRDPCILKLDNGDLLLYATGGQDHVACVLLGRSTDGIEWEVIEPALKVDSLKARWGFLESPYVIKHGEYYYMFINHSHHQYQETVVLVSDTPYQFDWNRPLCTLFSHAAELFTWHDKMYISHCGIEDKHWLAKGNEESSGLYLAELDWTNTGQ